jgi:predicted nucleotidyltransferase
MKRILQNFNDFLGEAKDPSYYQDTFNFTMLISMDKDRGGSRDETKNDIRAFPEVLTVTLVEPEKGGVQKDLGSKYLSTLKVHIRRPKDISKEIMMKRIVKMSSRLSGVSVLRYKERKPKQRKKVFRGPGSYKITEADTPDSIRERKKKKKKIKGYQQSPSRRRNLRKGWRKYTQSGPNNTGPFKKVTAPPSWKSAPPGAVGGLEEAQLDEAMKTAADLPEDVVVVVRREPDGSGFKIYYAERDKPNVSLKAGDLDRMEAGIDIFGALHIGRGRNEPYEDVYIVTSSKAKDGFGPLLYDVALEMAGKSGLKPDVLDVSDDASAVWKHYDDQREDVDSQMLVRSVDDFNKVMPDDRAEDPGTNEHLAQVYFKKNRDITQELMGQDKLVELKPGTKITKTTPRDELEDLAGELDIPIVNNTDLSRFDRLYEAVMITIGQETQDDLLAFDVQPELNQKIWNSEESVRAGVKGALMDIVEEFMEGLDLDLDIKDIIITGSIANYNWSKFSDIDLHILLDFEEVNDDKDMVKKFFDAVRSNWNKLHDITVKGHEVEIYIQDEHEPHISTGVYSLKDDRWLVKPKKIRPAIDRHTATKKMKHLAREITKLKSLHELGKYEESYALASRIKEKIKKMRQGGLEKSGIYSPENLAFKMLRRSGDIEQLFTIYTAAYDKLYSIDQ